jgi:hypothetical protein
MCCKCVGVWLLWGGVANGCRRGRLRRCDEDDEGRTFELDLSVEPTIANSTELRCRAIDMETASGELAPAPRRSRRATAVLQARANASLDQPRPQQLVVPISTESVILSSCW